MCVCVCVCVCVAFTSVLFLFFVRSVVPDLAADSERLQSAATTVPQDVMDSNAQKSRTVSPPHLDFDTARPFSEMPAPFSLPIIGTMWMHMPGGE